jgi:hypothetical protein
MAVQHPRERKKRIAEERRWSIGFARRSGLAHSGFMSNVSALTCYNAIKRLEHTTGFWSSEAASRIQGLKILSNRAT